MFHYRLIVKFDTYRNLQQHCAVLPAIAQLSYSMYCYQPFLSKLNDDGDR